MIQPYDIIIHGSRYFDGTGAASAIRNIGIRDGRVAVVSSEPLDASACSKVIDANGKWVTPGFLDTHTHYDAEMIVSPSLSESVRHGVTTVLLGSCSLSMICSDAEDASDLFTRVETVPREKVLPILQHHKTWTTPKQWVDFVATRPLGPNLVSYLGHSDLRVATMGLHRATDRKSTPTEAELQTMERTLEDALDAGFLGLSTMCLKWDKIDGDREWSKSLPSTYARWSEFRRLNRLLRRRGRVHQGAPNAANPLQIFQYLHQTLALFGKPLKTTLISLIELKGNITVRPMAQLAGRIANWLGGNFRWQVIPTPFTVYADGIDVVFFEEFGAGELAMNLKTAVERNALFQDQSYRRSFRKFYGEKLSPRVWQRDFGDAIILDCPNKELVGRNFAEVATERGIHVVDLFLDLVVEFGRTLRWYTTVGNHKKAQLLKMVCDKNVQITFSDAGAHIRNMAFYNLPLRFLKLVQETHDSGQPIMPIEKAVWRLTGEQADWLGIDAGKIRVGDRADLVVIDPRGFGQNLEQVVWAEMENFDLQRLVNRNAGIVEQVVINGKLAVADGEIVPALGHEMGFGRFSAGMLMAEAGHKSVGATEENGWRSGFAELGVVRLHYIEAGSGPLVVLLHGFPEFWYSWRFQIAGLAAAGYRVVVPDLRGYNLSSRPLEVSDYDIDLLAADVRALIHERGARQAHIVGHDWGGGVAWMVGINHPEVVQSLTVLNCGHPRRMLDGLRHPRQLWRSWYMLFFQLPWVPERLFPHIRRFNFAFERDARPDAFSVEDMARYETVWAQPGAAAAMVNYYRAALRPGRKAALSRIHPITARTQVIWGRRDRYLDASLATPLPADVPNLEHVVFIDDATHWVQHDAPDKVLNLLLEFFKGSSIHTA